MTQYNTKYILAPKSGKNSLLDLRLKAGTLSLDDQNAVVLGSAEVDFVYASMGMNVDFTSSGAGADKLYLDGAVSDYKAYTEGTALILIRTVGSVTSSYKLSKTDTTDIVAFANGSLTVANLLGVAGASAAAAASLTTSVTGFSTGVNSLTAPDLTNVDATNRVSLQQSGTITATANPVKLIISGSAGVDTVYVKPGANVDATGLGGGMDKIYMSGKWADYTKTVSGTTMKFTRSIGGMTEEVIVSAGTGTLNDMLYFADGNIASYQAATKVKATPAVSLITAGGTVGSAAQVTPAVEVAASALTHISNDTSITTDFITATANQTLTGTYTGRLELGDKIQVKVGSTWLDVTSTNPTSSTGGEFTLSGVTLSEGVNNLETRVMSTLDSTRIKVGSGLIVTLDTSAPTTSLTPKAGQNTFVNASESGLDVEISVNHLKVGDKVQLKLGSNNLGSPITVTQAHLDNGAIYQNVAKSSLTEGVNDLTAVSTDVAGNNTTSLALSVTLDTQAPTPQIGLATVKADGTAFAKVADNDLYLNKTEDSVLLAIKGGDSTAHREFKEGDVIDLLKDGALLQGGHRVTAAEAVSNQVLFTVTKSSLGVDGTYGLTAKASDQAGNSTTSETSQSIVVDTTPPAPILSVSTTEADGTSPRPAGGSDASLAVSESNIILKVAAESTATGGNFKLGDVVSLSYLDTDGLTYKPVLDSSGAAYTATVQQDGGAVYFTMERGSAAGVGLQVGLNTLRASVLDLAGNSNTSNSLGVDVSAALVISNSEMVAGTLSNLEVNSQIVMSASSTISTAVAGKYLRIVNDTNTASKNGFDGESAVHSFSLDVSDTRFVTVVGNKIIIKPPFDLDLSNQYHIEIDAGAFEAQMTQGSGAVTIKNTVVDAGKNLNFSTVTVGANLAGAVQGRYMNDAGTLVNGKKWFSIEDLGSIDTAAALDLAGSDYALVFKDETTAGGLPSQSDGVGVGAKSFNIKASNFDAGDLIYVDDQANDATQLNAVHLTEIQENADGSVTVQFNPDQTTGRDAGLVQVVSGTAAGAIAIRSQIQMSNANMATSVDSIARVDVSGAGANLVGASVSAANPLKVKVSASKFASGDAVQLMYVDENGAEHNLGSPVVLGASEASAHEVTIEVADVSSLAQGYNTVYAKVTNAYGAVTHSPALNGPEGLTYDTQAPVAQLQIVSGQDATLTDTETTVDLYVNANDYAEGSTVVLKLNGSAYGSAVTVTDALRQSGITFTVQKSDLAIGNGNTLTVTGTDAANNTGTTNSVAINVLSYVTVSGSVGAGPILDGNDLVVTAYDAQGNQIGQDTTVVGGAYSFKLLSSQSGSPVLIKVTSAGNQPDFMDEATLLQTDLGAPALSAVFVLEAGGQSVNVNPLTDLAARHLMLDGKLKADATVTAVNEANVAISRAFVSSTETASITTLTPQFVVNGTGSSTAGTANALGFALAALSAQAQASGSVALAQQDIYAGINWGTTDNTITGLTGAASQANSLAKLNSAVAIATPSADAMMTQLSAMDLAGLGTLSATSQSALLSDLKAAAPNAVDSKAEIQSFVDKHVALAVLRSYADIGTQVPKLSDYANAGFAAVTTSNLSAVNKALFDSDAAGTASSAGLAQVIAAGVQSQLTALSKITAYANDNTKAVPTVNDYFVAGIVGVTADNLKQVNKQIDITDPAPSTLAAVQTLADSGNQLYSLAYQSLVHYIADPAVNAAPNEEQFATAGIDGVTSANLTAVQQVLAAMGKPESLTMATIKTGLYLVMGPIATYAADGTAKAPVLSDYSDLGVTGVTTNNLAAVNAKIDAASAVDVNTLAKVQALVSTSVEACRIALSKIGNYADSNANPAPQQSDYIDVGVTGVTTVNQVGLLNSVVDSKTAAETNETTTLQNLANAVRAVLAGAAGGTSPTEDQLKLLGFLDANSSNLAGIQAQIAATADDGSAVNTLAKLRSLLTNDAPTGANATLTVSQNAAYVFNQSDFGFADAADAVPNTLQAVIVTVLPASGTLKLNGVNVTAGQSIAVADIVAGKLVYQGALNGSGNNYATLMFKLQDNGGVLNGGQDTSLVANTLTFNLNPELAKVSYATGASLGPSAELGLGMSLTGTITLLSSATKSIQLTLSGAGLDTGNDKIVLDANLSLASSLATVNNKTIGGVSGLSYGYNSTSKILTLQKTDGSVLSATDSKAILEALKLSDSLASPTQGDRVAVVTLQDSRGNITERLNTTLTVDSISPLALDLDASAAGIQSAVTKLVNMSALSNGIVMANGVSTPQEGDIQTVKLTLSGAGLNASSNKLVLNQDISMETSLPTVTNQTIATITGLSYGYDSASKVLTLSKTNGSALTGTEVKSLVEAIKFKDTSAVAPAGSIVATWATTDRVGNASATASTTITVDSLVPDSISAALVSGNQKSFSIITLGDIMGSTNTHNFSMNESVNLTSFIPTGFTASTFLASIRGMVFELGGLGLTGNANTTSSALQGYATFSTGVAVGTTYALAIQNNVFVKSQPISFSITGGAPYMTAGTSYYSLTDVFSSESVAQTLNYNYGTGNIKFLYTFDTGRTSTTPTINVTYDGTKASVGDRIDLYEGSTLLGSKTLVAANVGAINTTVGVDVLSSLSFGNHSLVAKFVDAAGTVVTSSAVSVAIDVTASPPTVSNLKINGQLLNDSTTSYAQVSDYGANNNAALTFTGTLAQDSVVSITMGGKQLGFQKCLAGDFSITLPNSTVAPGFYNDLTVSVTDVSATSANGLTTRVSNQTLAWYYCTTGSLSQLKGSDGNDHMVLSNGNNTVVQTGGGNDDITLLYSVYAQSTPRTVTLTDFTLGKDTIKLLGQTVTASNINDYVKSTSAQTANGASLVIDLDGLGANTYTYTLLFNGIDYNATNVKTIFGV